MENYIIQKTDYIEYLQFNKLLEFQDELVHAFTLKTYDVGINKCNTNINENFNKIAKLFNVKNNEIYRVKQEHTDNIVEIKSGNEKLVSVDGLITNQKSKLEVITVADCICLMFYDPENKVIANIHSGWKGTIKRIGKKAIEMMIKDYNSKPKNIICCIGPSIRKDHFLVNEDVYKMFKNEFKELKDNIIEETNQYNEKGKQYRIDTVLINKLMLKNLGLIDKNIIDCKICTMCSNDKFHSYRIEKENYCKNMGIMMLK